MLNFDLLHIENLILINEYLNELKSGGEISQARNDSVRNSKAVAVLLVDRKSSTAAMGPPPRLSSRERGDND